MKPRFWLVIILFLFSILYVTDVYAGKYPSTPTAVTYPDFQTSINSGAIECPKLNIKLMPVDRNWWFKFTPPINIDWKSLEPKEIRNLNRNNPNQKVLDKFEYEPYGYKYYFSIKLDPILEKCFHYYLVTDDGVTELKPTKMIGAITTSSNLNKRPINLGAFDYYGWLVVKPIEREKTSLPRVLVVSIRKLNINIKKVYAKKDSNLMDMLKKHLVDDPNNGLEGFDRTNTLKLDIDGEGEYLFVEREFLPGNTCQFEYKLFQIGKDLKILDSFVLCHEI